MNYSQQVKDDARKVHEYLKEHGWRNDDKRPADGSCCVIWAGGNVYGNADAADHDIASLEEFFDAFKEEAQCYYIGSWNDAPGRTFAEVEEVLQRIYNS